MFFGLVVCFTPSLQLEENRQVRGRETDLELKRSILTNRQFKWLISAPTNPQLQTQKNISDTDICRTIFILDVWHLGQATNDALNWNHFRSNVPTHPLLPHISVSLLTLVHIASAVSLAPLTKEQSQTLQPISDRLTALQISIKIDMSTLYQMWLATAPKTAFYFKTDQLPVTYHHQYQTNQRSSAQTPPISWKNVSRHQWGQPS